MERSPCVVGRVERGAGMVDAASDRVAILLVANAAGPRSMGSAELPAPLRPSEERVERREDVDVLRTELATRRQAAGLLAGGAGGEHAAGGITLRRCALLLTRHRSDAACAGRRLPAIDAVLNGIPEVRGVERTGLELRRRGGVEERRTARKGERHEQ